MPNQATEPSNFQWIAFDAVGTLIYPDPPVAAVYARVGREEGSRLPDEEVGRRFRQVFQQLESEEVGLPAEWARTDRLRTDEKHERLRWRRIVRAVLDDARDPEICFQKLFDHFARPEAWKCYADVPDAVLGRFSRAGYRLALASNFDGRLHRILAGLTGLRGIEACVASTDAGYRKPSVHFFRRLCERLSADPSDVLVVGDDDVNDVQGAWRAGLRVYKLDRAGRFTGPEEFASLADLADALCRGKSAK